MGYKVQNTAARIVTRNVRSSHITPVLKSLHRLSFNYRINFKIFLHHSSCAVFT